MVWISFRSDEFVQLVNARCKEMLPTIQNMYETNALGANIIDTLMASYKPSFLRNYAAIEAGGAGWSLTYRYSVCDNALGLEYHAHPDTYEENVEFLRTWLKNRVDYLQTTWSTYEKNNAVKYLEAEKRTNTKIRLTWYNQGVADGVEIYVKAKGEKYKLVKTTKSGDVREYTVKNLKPGVKYYFKVRSFVNTDSGRLYSDYSDKASHKIKLKAPKVKANKKAKELPQME